MAEQLALKAIEIQPKSALAKSTLAVLIANFRTQSDYISSALSLFNEAIDIDPNLATTYNWRGLAYYSVKMLNKADKDCERCLEPEPLYSACYKWFPPQCAALDKDDFECD